MHRVRALPDGQLKHNTTYRRQTSGRTQFKPFDPRTGRPCVEGLCATSSAQKCPYRTVRGSDQVSPEDESPLCVERILKGEKYAISPFDKVFEPYLDFAVPRHCAFCASRRDGMVS